MKLKDTRVLQVVDEAFEDLELWYPVLRMREAGATVDIAGTEKGKVYTGKYGVPCESTHAFEDINPDDYDVLLVPGGWAPDKLRRYDSVLDIVKAMDKDKKVIGQICHAGWVLISADIVRDVTMTSTPALIDDLKNAGATWIDEPVVKSGHIISSRRPSDLPQYMETIIEAVVKDL